MISGTAAKTAPRRRRGILAFLPDTLQHFPYDNQVQQNKIQSLKRHRKSQNDNCKSVSPDSSISIATEEFVQDCAAVALLLVDPRQPSAMRLLVRFVELFAQQQSKDPFVVGIVIVWSLAPSVSSNTTLCDHLQGSGLGLCETTAASWWPRLQTVLSWTACPALAVVEPSQGRKISSQAEQVALEWNHQRGDKQDPVLQAWCQGQSALTVPQQVWAALVVPSAMPCSIL